MSSDGPRRSRLPAVAGGVAMALLLAGLPLWVGLPLWCVLVLAAWIRHRQTGLQPLAGLAQAGVAGLAVEIGRGIGHGAVGMLAGLLSILVLATLLALLFPPAGARQRMPADAADWQPMAAIGPPGASFLLSLSPSPACSEAAPRAIPGLQPTDTCWLWPAGWLLPAGLLPPEQDPEDHYAVMKAEHAGRAGSWLLQLAAARVYWLPGCQLAGWRDGRPWFEPIGGGRLLSMEDCLTVGERLSPTGTADLKDMAGLLPPRPTPPAVLGAGPGMPRIAMQFEWRVDLRRCADPLEPVRHPRFRLWIDDRDTGLAVAAGDAEALRWHAGAGRLQIRVADPQGQHRHWCWDARAGLSPADQDHPA